MRGTSGHFKVPMKKVTAGEVSQAAKEMMNIKPYKGPAVQAFNSIEIQSIKKLSISVEKYSCLDTLWLLSGVVTNDTINWKGFMSEIIKGHFECTSVIFNPMIPLNPETNEAIYSTMCFVKDQAVKMGMCCAALTFDQPFYLKASKIKFDGGNEFNNIHIRLGGFHQLMSFLGSVCKLLTGAGIKELWGSVYASKSIPKM